MIKTVYASEVAKLDSNVHTGGGTDDTAALQAVLDTGKIQENMTGTFDMRRENGEVHFIPAAG